MAGPSSPRSNSYPKQGKARDHSSQPSKRKKKNPPKKQSDNSDLNQSVQSSLFDKSNSKTNSKVEDNSRLLEADSSNRVTEKKSSPGKKSESNAMESVNLVANISLLSKNSKPIENKVNSDWTEVFSKKQRGRGRGSPTVGVVGSKGGVRAPERPVGGLQEREPGVASVKQQHEEDKKQLQITPPGIEIVVENQQFTADEETERVEKRVVRSTTKTEISVKSQKNVANPLVQGTLKYKETVETSTIEFEKSTTNTEEGVQNEKESKNAAKAKSLREDDRQSGARPKSSKQLSPDSGNLKSSSSDVPRAKTSRLQWQNQQKGQQTLEESFSRECKETKTCHHKDDGSLQYHNFNQRDNGRGQRGREGGQWAREEGQWARERVQWGREGGQWEREGGQWAREKGQWGKGGGQYGRGGPRMIVPLRPADKLPSFIQEIKDDLFNCGEVCSLAHCVSSDFKMGQGVAVEFKKRFKGVKELLSQGKGPGEVAFLKKEERYVYYLVTKKEYYHKPTIVSLEKSLIDLKKLVDEHKVTTLAMPRIGAGLDKLDWNVVLDCIIKTFQEGNVQITVYVHNPKFNRH